MSELSPQAKTVLMKEGFFHGLRMLLDRREISEAEASSAIMRVYGAVLLEIKEARSEMRHLDNVLNRLECIAQNGKSNRNGRPGDSNHHLLGENLVAFDGWAVSLMETVYTLTGMLNPAHTRGKLLKFTAAMNALMDRREAEQNPVLDDPSLFKSYFDV
jgi:hypothetical protein